MNKRLLLCANELVQNVLWSQVLQRIVVSRHCGLIANRHSQTRDKYMNCCFAHCTVKRPILTSYNYCLHFRPLVLSCVSWAGVHCSQCLSSPTYGQEPEPEQWYLPWCTTKCASWETSGTNPLERYSRLLHMFLRGYTSFEFLNPTLPKPYPNPNPPI